MPYNWNPEQKAQAIQSLIENMGSTYSASQDTGIPERTIQQWKQEVKYAKTVLIEREPDDSLEQVVQARYQRLRNDLLEHVDKLSQQFRANPAKATDLAIAMTRLIDRLHKLETLLQPRHFSLVILYEQSDGTIHDTLSLTAAIRKALKK
ncbi:MAG: hypothetical protein Q9P44_03935 [Anaerolineae bacterium]|nr:hypothetical protein [Anaerolineae bacterium]